MHGNVPEAFLEQVAMADGPVSPSEIEAARVLVAGTLSLNPPMGVGWVVFLGCGVVSGCWVWLLVGC